MAVFRYIAWRPLKLIKLKDKKRDFFVTAVSDAYFKLGKGKNRPTGLAVLEIVKKRPPPFLKFKNVGGRFHFSPSNMQYTGRKKHDIQLVPIVECKPLVFKSSLPDINI